MTQDDQTPDQTPDQQPDQHAAPADPAGQDAASPTEPAPVAPTVPPPGPPAPAAPVPAAAPPPPRSRWRDRLFSFRAMLAVTLAGLVLGAGAGAGTALVAAHADGPDFRHQRMGGPGQDGFPGWGGRNGRDGPPPGLGQQLPPGMTPQEEGEAPQDDSSEGTSGS